MRLYCSGRVPQSATPALPLATDAELQKEASSAQSKARSIFKIFAKNICSHREQEDTKVINAFLSMLKNCLWAVPRSNAANKRNCE